MSWTNKNQHMVALSSIVADCRQHQLLFGKSCGSSELFKNNVLIDNLVQIHRDNLNSFWLNLKPQVSLLKEANQGHYCFISGRIIYNRRYRCPTYVEWLLDGTTQLSLKGYPHNMSLNTHSLRHVCLKVHQLTQWMWDAFTLNEVDTWIYCTHSPSLLN